MPPTRSVHALLLWGKLGERGVLECGGTERWCRRHLQWHSGQFYRHWVAHCSTHLLSFPDKQPGSNNDLHTYPSADDVTSNTKADCYAISDDIRSDSKADCYAISDDIRSDSNAIRSQLRECDQ